MEKLLEKLLEVNRALEQANLGEFDFEHLHRVLCEFEKAAPQIIALEREHAVLRNNLIIQIRSRVRALELAREGQSASLWSDSGERLNSMTAENLLQMYAELSREFNAVFSSRPNFQRTVRSEQKQCGEENYKIGG